MNDRIREIGRKATMWCVSQPNQGDFDALWEEKFAELLIEESIAVMTQHDYHGEWLGEKLKEHFGVES